MDDFSKHISDSLNNPPEFPFDETAWRRLEGRLGKRNADEGRGGLGWGLPFALLATLLLLGGGWFFHLETQRMSTEISSLKTLLETQVNAPAIEETARRVTVVYDTIYRTVYVETTHTNQSAENHTSATASYHYWNTTKANIPSVGQLYQPNSTFFPNPLNTFDWLGEQKLPTDGNDLLAETTKDLPTPALLPYPGPNLLETTSFPDISIPTDLPTVSEKKKGLRYYLYKMQPTRFGLAGGAGRAFSIDGEGGGAGLFGLEAHLGYGEHLALTLGAEYLHWSLNISSSDSETLGKYPETQPNEPGDQLHEMYGDFHFLQIPIGLEYTFSKEKRWRPIIGLGLLAQQALRSRLTYEFDYASASGDYKIRQDNLLSQQFEVPAVWGIIGTQVRLHQHWHLRLLASLQWDLDGGEYPYEKLNLLKIRGGVQYAF